MPLNSHKQGELTAPLFCLFSQRFPMPWRPLTELPDLRRAGIVALDIETRDDRLRADMGSGWPFKAGHVCGFSVAYRAGGEMCAHYFPIRHPDSENFSSEQVCQWLRDLIASDVRFVTQNGLYDWAGFAPRRIFECRRRNAWRR
jgi:hypothetical protein